MTGRFGLPIADARQEIDRIVSVVRGWRESFVACGVSIADIEYIAPAMLPECFYFEAPPAPVG